MTGSIFAAGEEKEGARGEYRAPAVDKALDILEFMALQQDGLTQTEVALGVGRSIHEIYRILHLLERRGYLIRSSGDRYRLSLKLFELAQMHVPVNRLVESALPVMRRLAARTDQSCHLVVLNGLSVLVVAQIDSPLPMRYSVALGAQFPIAETSSGAVLLAGMEFSAQRQMVERIFASGQGFGTQAHLEARIEEARRRGSEVHASFAVEGCTNIALPVRDHTGAVTAALTVPFLPQRAARFAPPAVLAAAKAAAAEISAALGAPGRAEAAPSLSVRRRAGSEGRR